MSPRGPVLLATGLMAAAVLMTGCAAAVPIVSAASAGAAAGEAGFSFWSSGRLTYVDEGTVDEMNRAVAVMLPRLGLTIHDERDSFRNGQLDHRWWSVRSDRGHLVTIKVEPLTDALIQVEINAGPFGNRAAAELIADRIKDELDQIQQPDRTGRRQPVS